MTRVTRTLRTSILLASVSACIALPAAAQDAPPPAAPEPAAPDEPAPPRVLVGVQPKAEDNEVVVGATTPASRAGVDVGAGDWQFSYHGYFRAPMRIGIGKRELRPGQSTKDYSKTTLHAPLVPDDEYLSWQSTRHSLVDWAELFFSVGNSVARGTVAIEGYNFSQGSYSDPATQFGVSQGYVEVMPELPYDNARLTVKAGAMWNNYGEAGRYDAGQYDQFLFGRAKGMGESIRFEVDVDAITLAFEQGFLTKRPEPAQSNTARFSMMAHGHAFVLYEGLMVGAHLMHAWAQEEDRDGTGHGPPDYTAAQTDMYVAQYGTLPEGIGGNWQLPDGHITIAGLEVKYDNGMYGLGYLGFAHLDARHALTIAPVVEWEHSDGGGEYNMGITSNYLDNPRCNTSMPLVANSETSEGCSSGGTGKIETLMFQYDFSVSSFLSGLHDREFGGDGMDFITSLYAMYAKVKSAYDPHEDGLAMLISATDPPDYYSDHSQLKFGADFLFLAFPSLGGAVRVDRVQPNNHLPEQSFTILSPRLEFRSRWITRETIVLQYSRYFYAKRNCDIISPYDPTAPASEADYPRAFSGFPANQRCVQPPAGSLAPTGWGSLQMNGNAEERGQPVAGGNPNAVTPDVNVIQLSAEMWW
jgi:hypothetical protein